MNRLRTKKVVLLVCVLLFIILILVAARYGVGYLSEKYARNQANYISNNDVDILFDNFAPELRNNYSDKEAFFASDAGLLLVEPIQKVTFELQQEGNFLGGVYKYHLVREDDPEQGYTLIVTTTRGLWGKKVKDVTLQPVRFLEEQ